jgi:hypothetical protein
MDDWLDGWAIKSDCFTNFYVTLIYRIISKKLPNANLAGKMVKKFLYMHVSFDGLSLHG